MNLGIANVALPSIGRELHASQTQITAIANAFTLGLACSVLYLGALGDRYGRKLLFTLGATEATRDRPAEERERIQARAAWRRARRRRPEADG